MGTKLLLNEQCSVNESKKGNLPEDEYPGASHGENQEGNVSLDRVVSAHVKCQVRVVLVVHSPVSTDESTAEGEKDLEQENIKDGRVGHLHHLGHLVD